MVFPVARNDVLVCAYVMLCVPAEKYIQDLISSDTLRIAVHDCLMAASFEFDVVTQVCFVSVFCVDFCVLRVLHWAHCVCVLLWRARSCHARHMFRM